MKYFLLILLVTMQLFLIPACTDFQMDLATPTSTQLSTHTNTPSDQPDATFSTDFSGTHQNGYNVSAFSELTFTDFDTKQSATIYTLPQINDQYKGKPYEYAWCDLDGNGTEELLVQYDFSGDTAIITMDVNNATAYNVPYRGISQLKTDGTMSGSDSAAEGTIHKITFSSDGLVYNNILTYNSGDISGIKLYTFYGNTITEDECNLQLELQSKKENVTWHNFNEWQSN